jgi:hypothetical protein
MNTSDVRAAMGPIVDAFQKLGVPYSIAGSVASSVQGVLRATLDVDLVADLAMPHVRPLVEVLSSGYYIEQDAVTDAVRRRTMFNVVHLETMLKVDVYVLSRRPYDVESFRRRRPVALERDVAPDLMMDTPEDTVLHKLEWYRIGHEVSERQWGDVIGVLKVQGTALDFAYMRRWAREIEVEDLLERALAEAGVVVTGG